MSADFFLDQLASISVEEIQAIEEDAEISASVLAYEEANVPASLIEEITGKGMEGGTLELDGDVDVDVMGVLAGEEGGELEEVDFENVDSHTIVPKDEDGNPIRSQAVYVDEHTCVGCTLCSTVATSTFFMEQEMGRARVFQQWGDDDETVAIAIETCPVDCIHYVSYEDLARLEVERRGQNINFKARLVSQGEGGYAQGNRVGGAVAFTGMQKITTGGRTRCNNCPTRGCKDCPMYGVGESPAFKEREEKRLKRKKEKDMEKERLKEQKRADL